MLSISSTLYVTAFRFDLVSLLYQEFYVLLCIFSKALKLALTIFSRLSYDEMRSINLEKHITSVNIEKRWRSPEILAEHQTEYLRNR